MGSIFKRPGFFSCKIQSSTWPRSFCDASFFERNTKMKSVDQLQNEMAQVVLTTGTQLEKLLGKQVPISVDGSVNNYIALSALTSASG
mgnify:CR=1 FL=1